MTMSKQLGKILAELEKLDSVEGVLHKDLVDKMDRAHDLLSDVMEDAKDAGM